MEDIEGIEKLLPAEVARALHRLKILREAPARIERSAAYNDGKLTPQRFKRVQ